MVVVFSISNFLMLLINMIIGWLKAKECLKRGKEKVGHYFHSSGE
jgi:hypothetical protein